MKSKRIILILASFMLFLACFAVFIPKTQKEVYSYDNITEYRAKLAQLNEKYFNDFQSRIIVKSKYRVEDDNAIFSASGFAGLHVLQYQNENDALNALEYYSASPYVDYVEQDLEITINDIVNYDENFSMEGLEYLSWGSEILGISTYQKYILEKYTDNLPELFVAVLDTGIDTDNEFLQGRIAYDLGISYYDSELYLSEKSNYSFEDDNSHGTHVSGTIVDLTLDNIKIIPIKVLNSAGSGSLSNIISGLEYVLNLKNSGTNICALNMSLGGYGISREKETAINACYDANIMPVVAAGNDNYYAEKFTPANCEKALTISALSQNEYYENFPYIASYSNYGEVVDLCLPGTKILSCVPDNSRYQTIYTSSTGGKYAVISGTSMATPHATALVCLYATYYGDTYNVGEIETKIKQNTYDFGDIGKDDLYGYGVPSMALAIDKFTINNVPSLNYGKVNSSCAFEDKTDVQITNTNIDLEDYTYKIYYTLDGSYPTLVNFSEYTQPIEICSSALLRFVIYLFDNQGNVCADSSLYEIKYCKNEQSVNTDGTGFQIDNDGVLTKYTSGLSDIVIPQYVNGVKVAGLADNLFFGLNITSVICDFDIDIGYYPFVSCGSLKTLKMNSSSANWLAKNCFSLKEIVLPNIEEFEEGLYPSSPLLGYYGSSTFVGCFNLEIFSAPKVMEVKKNSFSGFAKLKRVDIDWSNVHAIGKYAFEDCASLSMDLVVNNLKDLGKSSFTGCGITSFSSQSLEVIRYSTFSDCDNLVTLYLPNVKVIEDYGIYLDNLKTLFLGDNRLKLYNLSITIPYYSNTVIYCYDIEYISQFVNKTFVDMHPTISENASESIDLTISGHNPVVRVYRSQDEVLSIDDTLINVTSYEGLQVTKNYVFDYLNYGENYYIVVLNDYYNNKNTIVLNKTGTGKLYDIMINSNIEQDVIASNSFSYNYNDLVELKLNKIVGYILVSITMDGIEITDLFSDNTYSFIMPNRNVVIDVVYLPIYYNVELNIVGDGDCQILSIDGTDITKATYKQLLTLQYSSINFYLASVYYRTEQGVIVYLDINLSSNTTSFEMPDSNITVFVTFKDSSLSNFEIYYNMYDYTYMLFSYEGRDKYIKVPQYVVRSGYRYRFDGFSGYCFYGCDQIESVEVNFIDENRDITVYESSFSECSSLKYLNIGNIISIHERAFDGCYNLAIIDLSQCKYIGESSFKDCRSLQNIDLSNCENMQEYAFYNCNSLSEVKLSEKLEYIPKRAFMYCDNLKHINLENAKRIGEYAFYKCQSLERIDLSNCLILEGSLTDSGNNFYYCTSLAEVKNGDKLEVIPAKAFEFCSQLKIFDFTKCKELGSRAFSNCENLEIVDLSYISKIGAYPLIDTKRIIFGKNNYLLETENLELSIMLRFMYVDKDYTGNFSSYYSEKFTFNYELDDYYVYSAFKSSTVTFKFIDGSIISSDIYSSIDKIAVPTIYRDNTYIYTIKNWKLNGGTTIVAPNDITVTYNDVEYIVNEYEKEYINYVIKFYYGFDFDGSGILNDEGDLYAVLNYHYGDEIVFPVGPSRPSTKSTVYAFASWCWNNNSYSKDSILKVSGDMNLIANYLESAMQYLVSWYDGDGNLIYQEKVDYNNMPCYNAELYGAPHKTSEDKKYFYYVFKGWSPTLNNVTQDISFYAVFNRELCVYTITYYYGVDYDNSGIIDDAGDIFLTKTYNYYDTIENFVCNYTYNILKKHYYFAKWDIEMQNKTMSQLSEYIDSDKNVKVRALYDSKNIYVVKWLNWDNSLIYEGICVEGEVPTYCEEEYNIPQKNSNEYYNYEFVSWSPTLSVIERDMTYTAQFKETVRLYDISWYDGNSKLIYTVKLPYNSQIVFDDEKYSLPTCYSTEHFKYVFKCWRNKADDERVVENKAFWPDFNIYNKVETINDTYQMVDISFFNNPNTIDIEISDLNAGKKLKLIFKDVALEFDDVSVNGFLTSGKQSMSCSAYTNYHVQKRGRDTVYATFYLSLLLDNRVTNYIDGSVNVLVNFVPVEDCDIIYYEKMTQKELSYENPSSTTSSFTITQLVTYMFIKIEPASVWDLVLIISIPIVSCLVISLVVFKIVKRKKRKMLIIEK